MLPSLPAPPELLYRCEKLLEYLFRGPSLGDGEGCSSPSALANDRRSPKLDGVKGGEGLLPIPIGDGGIGIRDEVGDVVGKGREGREGMPVDESGEGCRIEGGPE